MATPNTNCPKSLSISMGTITLKSGAPSNCNVCVRIPSLEVVTISSPSSFSVATAAAGLLVSGGGGEGTVVKSSGASIGCSYSSAVSSSTDSPKVGSEGVVLNWAPKSGIFPFACSDFQMLSRSGSGVISNRSAMPAGGAWEGSASQGGISSSVCP